MSSITGNQHLKCGVGIGAGISACVVANKITTGDISMDLVLSTVGLFGGTVFGSLLPDIDHDGSILGSKVKSIRHIVKNIVLLFLVVTLIHTTITSGISKTVGLSIILLVYVIIGRFVGSKVFSKQLKFITMHRGIYHTLLFACVVYSISMFISSFMSSILIGVSLGILVHLLGDMCTVKGVPLLFPVVRFNIRLLSLNSKKNRDKALLEVISILFLIIPIILGGYRCLTLLGVIFM